MGVDYTFDDMHKGQSSHRHSCNEYTPYISAIMSTLASAFARSKKPMPKQLIFSRVQEIPGDQPGPMIEAAAEAAHCAD